MDLIRLFSDGFPLTIERIQFLQNTYTKAISQLTSIAGSGNLIIEGAIISGSNISDGILIIDKEIIAFEGGVYDERIAVFETVNEVPYNVDEDDDGNLDLKAADVVRVARCASSGGIDAVQYSTFKRVGSLQALQMPIGAIIPFDGDINNIPAGWELYTAIQDRFIMGAGGSQSLNSEGGSNTVSLNVSEMPAHSHSGTTSSNGQHSHSVPRESGPNTGTGVHFRIEGNNRDRIQGQPAGAHTHTFTTNTQGSGQPHENKPAFKALNFIKFVGF